MWRREDAGVEMLPGGQRWESAFTKSPLVSRRARRRSSANALRRERARVRARDQRRERAEYAQREPIEWIGV